MPKFLLKRVDAKQGDVAALIIDAETPMTALAKAPAGCWKLHREISPAETRAAKAEILLGPPRA